jgi:7 transmembrane receptor (rhodopsin family)
VQTTNMLIANQTLADLTISLLILAPMQIGQNLSHDSIWDQFFCRFWSSGYFIYVALLASTYNILALTAERYVAVLYPVLHKVCIQGHPNSASL